MPVSPASTTADDRWRATHLGRVMGHALRRFDELNARVEDPKLWDNPKEAEAVMRERRRLEASIGTVNQISQEMADAIEYVELGEAEGEGGCSPRIDEAQDRKSSTWR